MSERFEYDEHELRTPQPNTTPPDDDEEEGPRPTASKWTNSIRNRLFEARTLIISGEVNQKLASEVMGQLLALDAESAEVLAEIRALL